MAEGRCTVAIDLLHFRAYKNFTTKRLGDLLHAAITPAALHTDERGISVNNLRSANYTRYSVLLDRKSRGNESCPCADRDSRKREELVRLLVKDYGVNVNKMLPSIPETPVTLVARCNGSSSRMLSCLLEDLGADITKTNRNGDTAVHCAMRLYSREWAKLDQGRTYKLDNDHNGDWWVGDTGVGLCPDSVLLSLVSCRPGKEILTVKKNGGISVWDCIFIHWKGRRYLDLVTALDNQDGPWCPNKTVTPYDMKSMLLARIEKIRRVEFVETLLGGRCHATDAMSGRLFRQGGPGQQHVIHEATAELHEIRRKLGLPPRKWNE